jgi:hypothetical protein
MNISKRTRQDMYFATSAAICVTVATFFVTPNAAQPVNEKEGWKPALEGPWGKY